MENVIKIKVDGYEFKCYEDTVEEANPYAMELVDGEFLMGRTVTVKLADGKQYTRKVRDARMDGLHIVINNKKYFDTDIIK